MNLPTLPCCPLPLCCHVTCFVWDAQFATRGQCSVHCWYWKPDFSKSMPCCLVYVIKVRKGVGMWRPGNENMLHVHMRLQNEVKYSSAINTLYQGYIKNFTLTQHIINYDFNQMDHPSCRTPHIRHIAQLGQRRMSCWSCCRAQVLTLKQSGKKTTMRERGLTDCSSSQFFRNHYTSVEGRMWKEQNDWKGEAKVCAACQATSISFIFALALRGRFHTGMSNMCQITSEILDKVFDTIGKMTKETGMICSKYIYIYKTIFKYI